MADLAHQQDFVPDYEDVEYGHHVGGDQSTNGSVQGYHDQMYSGNQDPTKRKLAYSGIHSSGFNDFLLRPELLRAVADCGFEHPSEGRGTYN